MRKTRSPYKRRTSRMSTSVNLVTPDESYTPTISYQEHRRQLDEYEKTLDTFEDKIRTCEQREGVYRAALQEVLRDLEARAQTVRSVLDGLKWDR